MNHCLAVMILAVIFVESVYRFGRILIFEADRRNGTQEGD